MADKIAERYFSTKNARELAAELKGLIPSNSTVAAAALRLINAKLESIENDHLKSLGTELNAAQLLNAHGLEEETFPIIKELFNLYIARNDFTNASIFLSKAPLLKDDFKLPEEERFQLILNLITAYLEIKQSISCEVILMKAHSLAKKIQNKDLLIQYHYCCGQFYNFNRKFLLSGMRYYAACNIDSASISPEVIAEMLLQAIDVTILAPTGSQKSFLVANLIKDERAKAFKNYLLLQKINKEVLIFKEEVDSFCAGLKTHQNIREKDGFTNVEKVFLEHNILVISKYYRDIRIDSLAAKLKVRRNELESILQNMKIEDKINLEIDHATDTIYLKGQKEVIAEARASLSTFCDLLDKFVI
jgi:hypothetical protein